MGMASQMHNKSSTVDLMVKLTYRNVKFLASGIGMASQVHIKSS